MHVEPHHSPDQLAALARSEPSGRVARRLLAVRLAMLGQAAEAVGPQVLLSGPQVRTWVARYNTGRTDALADAAGRGRRPALDADYESRLAARLRAGPTPADGVCTLRGEDVRRILRDEVGVLRCLQAVYDLLHELGFEPLRPRPRHPSASAEAHADFKKVSPTGLPRSGRPAPASRSRCGSRTRRGSASRAR